MNFFSKESFNPITDLPDLSGKVIIVTGGNHGIGYATIKHLARKGAKVYMFARNKAKAEEAIKKLNQEGLGPGNGQIIWLELDLVDPRNAVKAAQEFMKMEKRLDVLVHNAALLLENYQLTPDGLERQFTVNMISPFVLTRELMPILNQTAAEPNSDVRIVVVASEIHKQIKPRYRIDDINDDFNNTWFPMWYRYAYSKLANILYASELQRRLAAEGSPITVVSLHPGAVNTFSRRPELRRVSWLVEALIYPFFVNIDVGGFTSAFAAGSLEVTQNPKYKGAYLVPVSIIRKLNETAASEELAKELWTTIESVLVERGI